MLTKSQTASVALAASLAVFASACSENKTPSAANTNASAASATTSEVSTATSATATSQALPTSSPAAPVVSTSPASSITPTAPTTINTLTASAANQSPSSAPAATPIKSATTPAVASSGAQDFFVFTAARGALNNDEQLKNERITVDVKNGVVLLTGSVTDQSLKTRAEQLARQIKDVKAVKSSLVIAPAK